ncbi:unnamed protein product, partial [Brenthis ino]
MGTSIEYDYLDTKKFPTSKIVAVESTLQQTIKQFKDLVVEIEELHLENRNYRSLLSQKEKCDLYNCNVCENLRKELFSKENILKSIVSALHKLNETRDFNILNTIFHLIQNQPLVLSPMRDKITEEKQVEINKLSPNEETCNNNNESVSEIESTLIGRKSPIIFTKKKTSTHSLSLKDKKKCPESWPTPEKRNIKLIFPTPTRATNKASSSRLKQARLNLVKVKTCNVVDLTCSPEVIGRCYSENNLQQNIKQEIIDNDDTIQPSPTSGPIFQPICKSILRESPNKNRKPFVSKIKIEENMPLNTDIDVKQMEESINILQQYPPKLNTPIKQEKCNDETMCPDESISLLQRVNIAVSKNIISPKKPLTENINVTNTQPADAEASMSILQRDVIPVDNKRFKSDMEPLYKEPAARKKMEKRALPGWGCDDCKQFYDDLYKDDPEMLAKKMEECSKHRGRCNPVRPKTPDGFWNPRWEVPQDTEEFNRRNNV